MKPRGERYLQDCLWKESLLAIKVSLGCQSVAELIVRLREHLPQNSAETRERNASIILSRFFPTSEIDQLPRRILRTYDDETLLAAVMRVLFLEAEPLVVASQAPPPAKLMGGARGDRFKVMSLFAGEHSAREYDAIVSSVVRDVLPDRLPEGNAYYDHYYRT